MNLTNHFRRPTDVHPLIWVLRVGFLALYWVVWAWFRGANALIAVLFVTIWVHGSYHGPIWFGSNLVTIEWFLTSYVIYFMPFYVFYNRFFIIIFDRLKNFIAVHVCNHVLLSMLSFFLFVVGDHDKIFISFLFFTALLLFDILILLFFLFSKQYGFFRKDHPE